MKSMDKTISSNKRKNEVKNSKFLVIKSFIIKYKSILLWVFLFVIDIILIICFAKDNYANYARLEGNTIFVGDTKNLLFGRNYIGLIVTFFIYTYGIIVEKILCRNKLNLKKLVGLFFLIFVLNMIFFYLFTNKIY